MREREKNHWKERSQFLANPGLLTDPLKLWKCMREWTGKKQTKIGRLQLCQLDDMGNLFLAIHQKDFQLLIFDSIWQLTRWHFDRHFSVEFSEVLMRAAPLFFSSENRLDLMLPCWLTSSLWSPFLYPHIAVISWADSDSVWNMLSWPFPSILYTPS